MHLIRVLFAVLALLVLSPAHAAVPKGPGDCSATSPIPAGTVVSGCGDFGPSNPKFTIQVSDSNATTTWCVGGPVCNQVGFQQTHSWNTVSLCPSGSTPNAQGTCDCSAGYIEQGGKCVDQNIQCAPTAGQVSVINYTVGWARSGNADADDHVGQIVFPNAGGRASSCVSGCSWDFTDNGVAAYRSAEPYPASGLHRLSVDFTMRGAGTVCTESAADQAAKPTAPEPPCPGFVGEVNGVTRCVGTASQPVPPPSGAGAGRQAGGREDLGNPSAGVKPSTGDGSGVGGAGRTPSAGTGGNAGGPIGAIGGGGVEPDGTTAKPAEGKEQAACGAPGQPKCGIDESGTPSPWAENRWDSRIGDYRRAADDALGQIKTAGDGTFSGFGAFFMAPPLAACEPLEFPGDIGSLSKQCDVVDGVRSVMAYIWALGALWLCLGWIKKATA